MTSDPTGSPKSTPTDQYDKHSRQGGVVTAPDRIEPFPLVVALLARLAVVVQEADERAIEAERR